MLLPTIEMKCPNCGRKAAFHSETIHLHMKVVPDLNGKAICAHCGFNRPFAFSNEHYYYQVPVGKRILFARTLECLIALRAYFKEGKKIFWDPNEDFPKVFYQNRHKIIKEIDKIVREQST